MIAMQYDITLPADYDMAVIRHRIATKGHLLDAFPGLVFKAYLHAARDDAELPSRDNLYAPFYLWSGHQGMAAFLGGVGFAGLARDFGRPRVDTWMPWQVALAADVRGAASATRECVALRPGESLVEVSETEAGTLQRHRAAGALAAISALDPTRWRLLRFCLWPDPRPGRAGADTQSYRVGHVSQPGASR